MLIVGLVMEMELELSKNRWLFPKFRDRSEKSKKLNQSLYKKRTQIDRPPRGIWNIYIIKSSLIFHFPLDLYLFLNLVLIDLYKKKEKKTNQCTRSQFAFLYLFPAPASVRTPYILFRFLLNLFSFFTSVYPISFLIFLYKIPNGDQGKLCF